MDQKITFVLVLALTGMADGFVLNNSAEHSSPRSKWSRRNIPDNSFGHSRNGISSSSVPNHSQQSGQPGPSKSIRTSVNINNIPIKPGETKVIQHTLIVSKPARKRTQNNQPPNTIDNTINNNGGRGASNHLGSNNIHGIGQNFNNNGPKGANNHIGSNMAPGIGANNFGINNDGGFNGHGPAIGHNAISNGLGNSHTSNGQGVRQNSNGFGNGLKSINHGNGQNSLDPGNWHNSNSLGNELNSNSNGFGNEPNSNGHGNRPNLNSNGNGHNSNSNSFQSSVQNHGSGSPGAGRRGLEIIFVDLGSHSRLLPTATIGDQTHANSAQHPSIPSAVDIFNHPKELQINNGANLNQRVVSPDVAPAQRLFQVQLPSGQSEFYLINPIHPVGNNTAKNALSLTAAGGRKGTATASNSVTVTKSFLGMEDVVTTAQPAEEPPEINGQQEIEP